MKVTITEDPPKIDLEIDYGVEKNLKSFKEEVLETLYSHSKSFNIDKILLSDGMDSSFIALCLKELGLFFTPLSFIFETQSKVVTEKINSFCSQIGLVPSYFCIKEKEFFEFVNYLVFEKKIAYPYLNGFYISYILETFKENFFTGMTCEFKYYNNEYLEVGMVMPYLVKRNNPNRLFGFSNSRTFLSYINHLKFKENYKSINNLSNPLYLRDIIYTNIFPSLPKRRKGSWFDDSISKKFQRLKLSYKKEVPWVFELQNVRFNIHDYFNSKNSTYK